jgi:COG0732: restriction endonuclease S subunits
MKNNRTFLEKLLDGAEVEWKPVKSLCNDNFWLMPATPEFDDNGTIPYITSKNIKGGKIDFQNTKYINEHVYQELSRTRCIVENDILISMIGTIGEAAIVKQENLFFYGQNMYILRLNNKLVNHKFFLYYFTAPFILNSLLSKKNSSNQGYLKAGQIENLKIPIPPLSVQTEIVKILDTLTALTSELTSELTLRRKQYEYYREKLLSEEELRKAGVEWRTIDEIFHLKNGYTPSKSIKEYWENGSIPWFRMEDIRENGRILNTSLQKVSESAVKGGRLFPANSIIVATSATIGEHALITIPFLANQRFTVLSLKPEYIDKFNIYFLYYYCFIFDDWCLKNTTVSSFSSVDMNGFRKFRIPLIQLKEQQRIVSILDKFETLTNSITEGLPLAIEQSQKRYEYYRELLLNFS